MSRYRPLQRLIYGGLLLMLGISFSVFGQDRAEYNIVTDIGTSAKMIAIGNVEGFVDGPSVLMDNPAGLYRQQKNHALSLFSTTLINEVHYTLLAYGQKRANYNWGISVMDSQVFDIPDTFLQDGTDGETIERQGFFNYREAIYKLAYQRSLSEQLHVGGSLVYLTKNVLDVRAAGYNVDLGAIYATPEYELSFAFRNALLRSGVKYTRETDGAYDAYERIPFHLVFGGKYPFGQYNAYGQLKWQQDNTLLGFGLDYTPERLPYFELSGGYKEYLVIRDVKSNYVFGLALKFDGLRFQYTYEKGEHIEFDNKSYFSIDVQF